MSLIISPHTCSMSSTSRQSSPANSAHVSPKLRPPSEWNHTQTSGETGQRRRGPPNHALAISQDPFGTFSDTSDPFIAQYIRPTTSLKHDFYIKSLNRQTRASSYDYYRKYLKHDKISSPKAIKLRKDDSSERKSFSPLRQETIYSDNPEISKEKDPLYQQVPQRRRNFGNDASKQPELKKLQPQVKVQTLSKKFEECHTADLITLMARMIQSLISLNDRTVPASVSCPPSEKVSGISSEQKNKLLTRYHSRTPPAISIHTYISRLARFNNLTPATLLTTIYYIDLLSHNFQPYFTLNSWTVHRFLLVATMLAQKSLEDFFYTNDHYARVGGVALTELNFLELDFLNRVDWKLVPAKQISPTQTSIRHSKEVLDLYYWQLINLMGKNTTDKDKVTYSLVG
ncbi:hypothetical protein OXX69_007325 [Metschnikowia pulcherrima]